MAMPPPDVVIVGPVGDTHISGSLAHAAGSLGLSCVVIDTAPAYTGPRLPRVVLWHWGGKQPYQLHAFAERVCRQLAADPPRWLIAVGQTPITAAALHTLRALGTRCLIYSTDDPWNPAHRALWHLEALPHYDTIFSTRRSTLADFARLGCADVRYLPFAYDERLFRPPAEPTPEVSDASVLFVGGADRDRAAFFRTFVRHGPVPTLVGAYWERYADNRPLSIGRKPAEELRSLTAGAAVNLCLVRRANRDGHVMRSFEIPACGGFMIAEETDEHREILGPEGECALFFTGPRDAAEKVRLALADPAGRRRMARAGHLRIVSQHHTYRDRLRQMLELAPA
jgi:spore maturation protein CgeB